VRDAVVVGGGPAGALAAYHLARGGARVLLLEKLALPRAKTCGGGLVRRALPLIPVSLEGLVERTCREVLMGVPGEGLLYRIRREESVITMTMRAPLDAALVGAAREAGAEVLAPCALRTVETVPGGVRLETERGPFRARFLVAADGALGRASRQAGWRPPPPGLPALEWEVDPGPEALRAFSDAARFDLAPDGYAWIFPKRRHLSVGILSVRRQAPSLAPRLWRYLEGYGLGEPRSVERRGFVIPMTPREGPLVRGPVILAGDAAGLADPITAEGITHALLSGRLAAEALLAEGFGEVGTRRAYHAALRRRVLGELRLARLLARFLYRPSRLRRSLFRRHGGAFCQALTEVMIGRRSYRSLLLSPLSYLRLLVARPGKGRLEHTRKGESS
jgi:geranylgeranyl reductase family protein